MKKVFMIFAACAAVFSCQKVSTENTLEPSEAYLSIALDEATKAHFGELADNKFPTLWNESFDNAAVVASGLKGAPAVNVSSDSKSVRFNFENVGMATLTAKKNPLYDADEHEYTYCVYSPFDNNYSDAHKVNERGGAYAQPEDYVRMWIPVSQTPGVGTPDENAVVLFGRITNRLETEEDLSISGLVLNHLTAYGKLSFRNLDLATGEKVETVVLTAAENICGAFAHKHKDGEDLYDVGSSLKSKVLTLNTEATTDIYFSVLPATLTALNIKVTTNKGSVFLKDLDLTERPLAFVKGQVQPVNVDMTDTKQDATPALTEAWLDFGTTGVVEGYNTIKTVPSTALSLNNKDGVESRGTVKVASGTFSFESPTGLSGAIIVAGISWPLDVWTDYLSATAPGSLEFAGLEADKTYKFIVLCCRNSGTHKNADGTAVRATEVTIGGEAKTAISGIKSGYESYREDLAVVFDEVTPDANGKVTVGLRGVGTHSTVTVANQIIVSAIHIIRNEE